MGKNLFLGFLFLQVISVTSNAVYAKDYLKKNDKVKEIADFLGVADKNISAECPQNTFGIDGVGADRSLYFCLDSQKKEKRCELSISGLDMPPAMYKISFEVMLEDKSPSDRWHSIMQIHSFPDFGEKWRCPPLSIEISKGKFRAYSRRDKSQISKTLGYNCAETGSSITSHEVINNIEVKYNEWNKLIFGMHATHMDNGSLKIKINESSSELKNHGNLYNDKKAPYLKLGVYKPAGWSNTEVKNGIPICVKYKNFNLNTSKE